MLDKLMPLYQLNEKHRN